MTLFVGTSGWQYRDWRGAFYPHDLPQGEWLEHYARRFRVVEVNSTFYRLPGRETFADWARRVPDDFVFAMKASRYLTHIKRLVDPASAVERLFEHAEPLGAKLGPVLVQLPPTLPFAPERLRATLDAVPPGARVAVEFREPGWFREESYALLAEHDAALCLADRGSRPETPVRRTASWGYVRFHAGRATPFPCYGRAALRSWAERVASLWSADADVYAFFNNDARACAPRDARQFALAARRAGLRPTRLPGAREVALA
jgi:uncharacterized protein YecE (DUF72 family)